MAKNANEKPLAEQISLIVHRLSTRDLAHFNENTLKAIIVSLLHQQSFYYIHSEYETDWKYMDIFLETVRGYTVNYEVALELKYLPKAGSKLLGSTFKTAIDQLNGYLETPKFNSRTNIKAWVIVCVGAKVHWKMVR